MTVWQHPKVWNHLTSLSDQRHLQVISELFTNFATEHREVYIPNDFLQFVMTACHHLRQSKRSNVVYNLAKAVGRMWPDSSDSHFPAKTMPMGLLEHMVHFFNADTLKQVSAWTSSSAMI